MLVYCVFGSTCIFSNHLSSSSVFRESIQSILLSKLLLSVLYIMTIILMKLSQHRFIELIIFITSIYHDATSRSDIKSCVKIKNAPVVHKLSYVIRPLVKSAEQKHNSLISQPKHMLWVLKRTVSMRRFF